MARWTTTALLVLAACGHGGGGKGDPRDASGGTDSATNGSACTRSDIEVVLGTGDIGYEPLASGEQVPLNHGPQGGWHVWTGVDVTDSEPEVSIEPKIEVPDFGIQISGGQPAQFVALSGYDEAACNGQFYGLRAFIDTDSASIDALCNGGFQPACDGAQALICALDGHELDFSVTVVDIVDGRTGTDEIEVVAGLDPADVPVCPPS